MICSSKKGKIYGLIKGNIKNVCHGSGKSIYHEDLGWI